jgi:hypothetical protein
MPSESEESQGFYEMLWDCPHCDTKGLLGKSQRHCPECGAPQDADKRYFPTPEQQKLVIDTAPPSGGADDGVQAPVVGGHVYEGADRVCPACQAPNGAKSKNCTQCGSPLDGGAEVAAKQDVPVAAPRHKRRLWPWIVGVIVVAIFAIWFFFIRKHSADVTVTGHRWERVIAIERYDDLHKEAWRNEVPSVVSNAPICYPKKRSSRSVSDGEDCHTERKDKKDGTFEQVKKCTPKTHNEDVMDDWCTFTVRGWGKISEAKAAGTGMVPGPSWPSPPEPDTAPEVLGNKRRGPRTEKLTLDFGPDDACEVVDTVWRRFADGAKAHVEVRSRSGGVVCDSL